MIRISTSCVVDGREVLVSAEDANPQTALLAVLAAASAIGAAPDAPASGKKPSGRRSKAEMDAARAAAGAAPTVGVVVPNAPPPDPHANPPGTLPGPMPPAEPLRAFGPPADQVPAATGPATWSDAPPLPQEGKQVGFDGPPPIADAGPPAAPPPPAPPPRSVEDDLRDQIDRTMKATIDLKPEWRDSVVGAYRKAADASGGDIFAMAEPALRRVLAGVQAYDQRVRQVLGR